MLETRLEEGQAGIRAAIARVRELAVTITQLCEGDGLKPHIIHEDKILEALAALGGPDSGERGPLDDLDDTAGNLDSAASDVIATLGDEDAPAPQDSLAGTSGHAHEDVAQCACGDSVASRREVQP